MDGKDEGLKVVPSELEFAVSVFGSATGKFILLISIKFGNMDGYFWSPYLPFSFAHSVSKVGWHNLVFSLL